jgi:hypothetical protein
MTMEKASDPQLAIDKQKSTAAAGRFLYSAIAGWR